MGNQEEQTDAAVRRGGLSVIQVLIQKGSFSLFSVSIKEVSVSIQKALSFSCWPSARSIVQVMFAARPFQPSPERKDNRSSTTVHIVFQAS